MSERLRVVVSTLATVAAMAVLLVGPDVSAGGGADEDSADRPVPAGLGGG